MKKKWTRRKFLEAGLKGSIVVGAGALETASAWRAGLTGNAPSAPPGLDRRERETLTAAMDEIIPTADGMPAASAVGGLEYLDRLARENPEIRSDLGKSLAALAGLAKKRFASAFAGLAGGKRVEVLKILEKEFPESFSSLRDLVYESYYTQPRVWKLVGYEFYATNQSGPRMKPFDEAILARARTKPRHYREVR